MHICIYNENVLLVTCPYIKCIVTLWWFTDTLVDHLRKFLKGSSFFFFRLLAWIHLDPLRLYRVNRYCIPVYHFDRNLITITPRYTKECRVHAEIRVVFSRSRDDRQEDEVRYQFTQERKQFSIHRSQDSTIPHTVA